MRAGQLTIPLTPDFCLTKHAVLLNGLRNNTFIIKMNDRLRIAAYVFVHVARRAEVLREQLLTIMTLLLHLLLKVTISAPYLTNVKQVVTFVAPSAPEVLLALKAEELAATAAVLAPDRVRKPIGRENGVILKRFWLLYLF